MAGFDWGSLIGAAVSIYGSRKASGTAKSAGNQAAAGATASNDLLKYFYDQDAARQQPFYNAGIAGMNEYLAMLGLPQQQQQGQLPAGMTADQYYLQQNPDVAASGMSAADHYERYGKSEGRQWGAPSIGPAQSNKTPQQLQQDAFAKFRAAPGYQFGLDQGQKQIEASAAARGSLNSGAILKALQRYGNDYADQQGYTPYMNKLASLWGGAQTAAGSLGQAGQSYGGQMGQNLQNAANARAQSTYAAGRAKQEGFQDAWGYANKMGASQGWWG